MRLASHAKRRFVDKAPRSQPWDALHRIADRAYPALRDLFAAAWPAMVAALDDEALARELTAGNLPGVLVLLEEAWARSTDATLREPVRQLMQGIVGQGAAASVPGLVAVLGPGVPARAVAFNTANPYVVDFVHTHSATLIREIGQETRQAIRSMLLANMEAGRGWRSLVPDIREMIGVTRRQAEALSALRVRAEAQGLRPAQVERLIASKTRVYKQLRARTISRTETLRSANAGAFLLQQDLVATGVMNPTQYKRHVVVTRDERLCQHCKDVKAQNISGVPLLAPFQTPAGPQQYPPWHVGCRCVTVTRRVTSVV